GSVRSQIFIERQLIRILLCNRAALPLDCTLKSRQPSCYRHSAPAERQSASQIMIEQLDLLIIGAGPAGLSAADAAAREGLSYLVIEKGTIANTIRQYPVGRTLFSTP